MYQNLKSRYYRWLAKRRLISRYDYLIEVDKILEEYITERILSGGSDEFLKKGREDLLGKQNSINEQKNMIAFLKKLK
jgi:hypothetical protein